MQNVQEAITSIFIQDMPVTEFGEASRPRSLLFMREL